MLIVDFVSYLVLERVDQITRTHIRLGTSQYLEIVGFKKLLTFVQKLLLERVLLTRGRVVTTRSCSTLMKDNQILYLLREASSGACSRSSDLRLSSRFDSG